MDEHHGSNETSRSDYHSKESNAESIGLESKKDNQAEGSEPTYNQNYPQDEIDAQLETFRRWVTQKFQESKLVEVVGMVTGIIVVILGIIGACIYYGQLEEMRHTNELTQQALSGNAETLRQTLAKMQSQVDATNGLTTEAQKQTPGIIKQATAAETAANIARDTLHVSQRAYLTVPTPTVDPDRKIFSIMILNEGHMPSGPVHAIFNEAMISVINLLSAHADVKNASEKHWTDTPIHEIFQQTHHDIGVVLPELDRDAYKSGHQIIVVTGFVTFRWVSKISHPDEFLLLANSLSCSYKDANSSGMRLFPVQPRNGKNNWVPEYPFAVNSIPTFTLV